MYIMQINYTYFTFLNSFVFIDTQTSVAQVSSFLIKELHLYVFVDIYTKLDHQVG
jgi:hypothetical protein